MYIETIPVGSLLTNCYLAADEKTSEAVVIDPGDEGKRILARVKILGLTIKYILLTHGHFDHILAAKGIQETTGAKLVVHQDDLPLLNNEIFSSIAGASAIISPDWLLKGWENIDFGDCNLNVLHTPGHSPGSICLVGEEAVFSGDTLFNLGIGRADLPGGNFDQLLESINTRLMLLDDKLKVYPGHGPVTTIGSERQNNPFLENAPRKNC